MISVDADMGNQNHNYFGRPRLDVFEQSVPVRQRRTARTPRRFGQVSGTPQANAPSADQRADPVGARAAATDHRKRQTEDRPGVLRRRLESHARTQVRDLEGFGY